MPPPPLMSAADSGLLLDLRCDIREAMLDWIAENCPDAFAKTRLAAPDPIGVEMESLKAA